MTRQPRRGLVAAFESLLGRTGPRGRGKRPSRVEQRRQLLAHRAALVEQICASALEAGEWNRLPARYQDALRAKWRPDLERLATRFLEQLAGTEAGSPCVTLDQDLNLHVTQHNHVRRRRRRRRPRLSRYVEEANRLGSLVLGHDQDGTPITFQASNLDRHMVVLGTTGMGKTALLSNLVVQLSRQGGPIVLIDPHKDFIAGVLPNLPRNRVRDVVYIDPSDLHSTWGINLIQMARDLVDESSPDYNMLVQRMIDQSVSYIVEALAILQEDTTGFHAGPSIRSLMRAGIMAAIEREDTSLVDVYSLLTKTDIQDLVVPTIARHHVRDFFQDTVRELPRDYLERVRNKLEIFLNSILVNTLCRRDECTSLPELLSQNKIIVVDLNRDRLSPDVSSLIGYLVLIIVMFAVDRREHADQRPLYLAVGEFSNFASRVTARWLPEARKKNASLILDFQHFDQVPEDVQKAIGNAGTWCVFRPTERDAPMLCKRLGLTTDTGQPLVHELLELPEHVARFQFDEPDEHSHQGARRRSMVTLRTLPPLRPPRNQEAALERFRAWSRTQHAKPNRLEDQRTVYSADAVGSRPVLEAIYEANLAIRRPTDYVLPTQNEKAVWALQNGCVTKVLIQSVLESKGYKLASGHFRQLLHSLRVQELVQVRKTEAGYLHTELTRRGLEEIQAYVVPNQSRNEGSSRHKSALLRLYKALCAWTPLSLHVPPQKVSGYTPDLVLSRLGDQVPDNRGNLLTDQGEVHFHVEAGSLRVPEHILHNIARAHAAGAEPIVVVAAADVDDDARTTLRHLHALLINRLTKEAGPPLRSEERDLQDRLRQQPGKAVFRLWIATSQHYLWEYDPLRHRFQSVPLRYRPGQAVEAPRHIEQVPSPAPQDAPAPARPEARASASLQTLLVPPSTPAPGPAPTRKRSKRKPGKRAVPEAAVLEVVRRVAGALLLEHGGDQIPRHALQEALGQHEQTKDLSTAAVDACLLELFALRPRKRNDHVVYLPD